MGPHYSARLRPSDFGEATWDLDHSGVCTTTHFLYEKAKERTAFKANG